MGQEEDEATFMRRMGNSSATVWHGLPFARSVFFTQFYELISHFSSCLTPVQDGTYVLFTQGVANQEGEQFGGLFGHL